METFFVGVDVGTGSVRAGLFDSTGKRRGMAVRSIQMWRPHPDWAEQSSADIWDAVGETVRGAVSTAGVPPEQVVGIGFDATCSLVVLDGSDNPLAVSGSGDDNRNIIVWMDHRAVAEADAINAGNHNVLRYVGGTISPEMEVPKLVWLKKHRPETWAAAGKFFDLPDYLTYRASGSDTRSLCTTVCKWTFLGDENRWDDDFFAAVGLGELPGDGRIGTTVRPMGERVGTLTPDAAKHLGLTTNTGVGVGIIDAHAGGIGLLGAVLQDGDNSDAALESALALIGGTSTCHMVVSREPRFVPGVWGPYYGAMVPGMHLTEGGQSATGILIDRTLQSHPAYALVQSRAAEQNRTVYEIVNDEVERLAAAAKLSSSALLTRDLHVFDGHLGNRSPLADPYARGIVDGLGLDDSLESLAVLYLATIQAVAYGTRAIVDAMNNAGHAITRIYAVGGGTKNPLFLREHADITGLPLLLPEEPESVLLGAALLGAVASGTFAGIPAAMKTMCRAGNRVEPGPQNAAFHAAKYACYREMYDQQVVRRERMRVV